MARARPHWEADLLRGLDFCRKIVEGLNPDAPESSKLEVVEDQLDQLAEILRKRRIELAQKR